MHKGLVIFVSILIAVLVSLLLVMGWYHMFGWTDFSFKSGEETYIPLLSPAPAIGTPPPDSDIAMDKIMFKNVVFTVTKGDVTKKINVTHRFNDMSKTKKNNLVKIKAYYRLLKPLNAFSFEIAGFNDTATVGVKPMPKEAQTSWQAATVTLTGKYRVF